MDHQLTDDAVIKEADTQHSKMTEDGLRNAYDFLIKYKDSANADVLWRIARAAIELSERTVLAKEEKKELTQKALELATKALEADEENWACHKWFPIALEGMGSYLGIEKQISEAFIVKDHLEKSRQLNPNDAMTIHRIGRWHKVYSDLSYYGLKIYRKNFGGHPTSTNKDALEMFELAEKMEPRFYSVNLLNLGSCYEKAGDVKRAIDIWKMMFDFDATNEEDKEALKKAEQFIKSYPDY